MQNTSKNIDLSVVIVSMNIRDMLRDCLKSLYAAIGTMRVEVIVVDNVSSDGTPEMVRKEFPKVNLILGRKIRGFGENNNIGLKKAKGRYKLLLNSDTLLTDKNILKEMLAWMENNPKVGAASCALLNSDRKSLQGSGGYFPTLPRVLAWMLFIDDIPGVDKIIKPFHPLHGASPIYKGEDYFKKSHKQDWITGAFFLMRGKALTQVGPFDEDFKMYVEEVDLSYRFSEAGWEIWYLPKWSIIHFGSMTVGSGNAVVWEFESIRHFFKKHYPSWQGPMLSFILATGAILRIFVFGILKGLDQAKIYVKALSKV